MVRCCAYLFCVCFFVWACLCVVSLLLLVYSVCEWICLVVYVVVVVLNVWYGMCVLCSCVCCNCCLCCVRGCVRVSCVVFCFPLCYVCLCCLLFICMWLRCICCLWFAYACYLLFVVRVMFVCLRVVWCVCCLLVFVFHGLKSEFVWLFPLCLFCAWFFFFFVLYGFVCVVLSVCFYVRCWSKYFFVCCLVVLRCLLLFSPLLFSFVCYRVMLVLFVCL